MTTVEQVKGCLALLAVGAILAVSVWTCAVAIPDSDRQTAWCVKNRDVVTVTAYNTGLSWGRVCIDLYEETK